MRRMTQDTTPGVAREPVQSGGVLPFPAPPTPTTLEASLEQAYKRHYDELWRYAAHYVGREEADDLVHSAVAEVWDRIRQKALPTPRSLLGLLMAAVSFRAIDYRKTIERREPLLIRYFHDFAA